MLHSGLLLISTVQRLLDSTLVIKAYSAVQ